ncbi:MAG: AAA family ATPase [Bacteroidota bacterium]
MEKELVQTQRQLVKVVFFGTESTGKTSLAKKFAALYNTQWVPEFMRLYLEDKWQTRKESCSPADILPIAKGQIQLENKMAAQSQQILFCDTNLLQVLTYAEIYYPSNDFDLLQKASKNHQYDLYVLTDIDVPWEADVLRDKPNEREKMHQAFKNTLEKNKLPYICVRGNLNERVKTLQPIINQLLKQKMNEFDG